jgi:thiamine pyrophosphokinase
MSSHHIVREKQEPALLVLGLDNFSDELLGQLLEWSPTVITTLQTAEKLVAYGITIDWIVGREFDEGLQPDVKRISSENGTLTRDALAFLVTNNFPSVNIVTDEFKLEDYRYFPDGIDLVIFFDNKKIYPVRTGYNKWKPAGETIELLTEAAKIQTTGLKSLDFNKYQTIADGFFSLQFEQQFLFIAEEL